MGSKLDSFLTKRCFLFCFVHVLITSLEIMRKITSVGLLYKSVILFSKIFYMFDVIIRVFCPRAGSSLQTQEPRLQFFPKADLPLQTQEPRLQFY